MRQAGPDKRVQRTHQAVLEAFFSLVLKHPYEGITVGDIVARAGIGRSTLYEHFPGKDAILAASLSRPFGVLADAVRAEDNTPALTALLEHFWENRTLARGLFAGRMRRHSVGVLVRLVQERLRADASGRRSALLLPARLAAIQVAEALFAPLAAWLTTDSGCPAERLAVALRRGALALTGTLSEGRPQRASGGERTRPGLMKRELERN